MLVSAAGFEVSQVARYMAVELDLEFAFNQPLIQQYPGLRQVFCEVRCEIEFKANSMRRWNVRRIRADKALRAYGIPCCHERSVGYSPVK